MHASATRVVGEYAIDRVQRPRPEAPQLQVRIQMLARLALIGVAFGWRAMFGTAAADETPKPAREKAVAACAEIPVRFNGRVTTLDVAATHWLRSLAETNVVVDKQERPLDPLGVWLDLAARHEHARDLRIVPIDDPRLLKLLELEPRPAPVRGGRANLYAFAEFAARMEEFEKERMRLNGPSADGTPQPAADPNALEYRRAVDDLGQRLALVFDLLRAFRGPSERSVEAFQSFQRDVQQLEQSSSVPAVIAPRTADERWLPYSTALWDKLRIEILGDDKRAPHPAVDVWNTLLTAWATADAPRVEALAPKLLEVARAARRSPFDFVAPAEWIEAGAAPAPTAAFYQDTQAHGFAVAAFTTSVDPNNCLVRINYFPTAASDPVRIVNHWRFESWLAPLDRPTLERQFRSTEVAGAKAISIEMVPARGLPGESPPASASVVVQRDADLFVVTLAGTTSAVAAQRENLELLLKSLRLGTSAEVASWFGPVAGDQDREPGDPRWFAVVAPGRRHAWCFLVPTLGALPAEKRADALRKAAEFMKFAERELADFPARDSSEPKDAAGKTPRRMPEGWGSDTWGAWYALDGDTELNLVVRPLADYASASEPILGHYLRSLLKLPLLDDARAKQQWTTEKVGDRSFRVFESAPVKE